MAIEDLGDQGLPGWTFSMEEVSAGAWRVRGWHVDGRSVERTGTDEVPLLKECVEDAKRLTGKRYANRT
jgi:hypothetical protein